MMAWRLLSGALGAMLLAYLLREFWTEFLWGQTAARRIGVTCALIFILAAIAIALHFALTGAA